MLIPLVEWDPSYNTSDADVQPSQLHGAIFNITGHINLPCDADNDLLLRAVNDGILHLWHTMVGSLKTQDMIVRCPATMNSYHSRITHRLCRMDLIIMVTLQNKRRCMQILQLIKLASDHHYCHSYKGVYQVCLIGTLTPMLMFMTLAWPLEITSSSSLPQTITITIVTATKGCTKCVWLEL